MLFSAHIQSQRSNKSNAKRKHSMNKTKRKQRRRK